MTTPAAYRTLRAALTTREPFRQSDLAQLAGVSVSQAHRVVRWLAARQHVERLPDGRYHVRGAAAVVNAVFPYQRTMSQNLAASVTVRAGKKDALDGLVRAGAILCMESALEEYSQFFRADRVCVYHSDPERLVLDLAPSQGGILPVQIYVPDIPLNGDLDENRRTTKFRTIVDLACDGRVYAAKELLEELWGVVID
ncbi:MAG: hypothetical protein HY556_07065 [Euryarchaeota archaeon]|nr:hypothetical protein [Euryarchaeota archaeon]